MSNQTMMAGNSMGPTDFENLNFGTVTTTSEIVTIPVVVDPTFTMTDYAIAVAKDLQRRNPLKYQTIEQQLGDESFESRLIEYVHGLLMIRVESIHDNCPNWRRAKELGIPPYIQWNISQFGEVYDFENGRKFVPEISSEVKYDINRMLEISNLLKAFQTDGVKLLFDAFPRNRQGDKETMSYVIIGDYIKGQNVSSHPAKSYITAFLGMKLKQESDHKILYGVRYDDVDYVRERLIMELSQW